MRRGLALAVTLLVAVGLVAVGARRTDDRGAGAPPTTAPSAPPPSEPSASTTATTTDSTTAPAGPVSCRTVRYTPPGGSALAGDLCAPAHPHHGVGIVVVHGGGGYAGDRHSSPAWVDAFDAAGYLTFAVDYRLFRLGDRGPVYPRQESDVKVAVQWLRSHAADLAIDPDRIVVQGVSAGAQLGGALLVTPDDPYFDAQKRWPGTSDRIDGFIGMYGYYDGFQLQPATVYGGPRDSGDPQVADRWHRADSMAKAASASGPAILFHAADDSIIAADQTKRFAAALDAAGRDVEATIVPSGGHGFDRPGGPTLSPQGEEVARTVLAWLDRHFPES
ncbi:MAG TPA: alpha/beta hydrolase [Acidimicrobiales bacterium]|nr:alpha/beta hydrolase [Acidimicrobiales bacterium]